RDGGGRRGFHLALEVLQLIARVAGLRMVFGIAGDLDAEPVAGAAAHELDELAGVAEFARHRLPRRQIAAQGDDVADAVAAVALELRGDLLARGRDARKVRRSLVARGADLEHGLERALAGRAAGAVGAGEEGGLQRAELLPGVPQLGSPLGRPRRKELEAEDPSVHS